MKRILLSLLTCSICVSTFAQIDTSKKIRPGNSDKWEIVKGNTKAVKSKLFVSLPEDAHWDMTIYAAGSNKVLSNTLVKKEFLLLPGSYDLEINKIRINGVPVEKGNNTRVKAGILNVTANGPWTLYDETHQTVLINTYYEQKRGLPVGKYTLYMNGQSENIEIKDEFQLTEHIESPHYEITPLEAMAAGMGKLSINIPKDTTMLVGDKWVTIPLLIRDTVKIRMSSSSNTYTIVELPKYLAVKTYEIRLNNIGFTVPVKSGQETRIKAGYLVITKKESDGGGFDGYVWDQLMGSDDIAWEWDLIVGHFVPSGAGYQYSAGTIASGKKRRIFALPPGEYTILKRNPDYTEGNVIYRAIIKDGEWVINGKKD